MDQKELVQKIITDVGGLENISSLTHCITRLRFTLKDNSKAKTAEIEKLDVLGTQQQGGAISSHYRKCCWTSLQ